MVKLTRTVRFSVNPGASADPSAWERAENTFAAYPSMRGLGRFYELVVRCRGEVDPRTGYFLNIKEIDQAVRSVAVPIIITACSKTPDADPADVLQQVVAPLNAALKGLLHGVKWQLTPYYSIEMCPMAKAPPTPTASTFLLRQQFDFAASHRLYVPELSEAENHRLFGKCASANGHGHNYRVEPCVEVPFQASDVPHASRFGLGDLEHLTATLIVDRFDHKHLNLDLPEFKPVNPSVENIAKVCFDILSPAIAKAPGSPTLRSVTVWETDKTSCTYGG